MQLEEFAKKYLESVGATKEKDEIYHGLIGDSVMELIALFKNQGHSGMSASVTAHFFNAILTGWQDPKHPFWKQYWTQADQRKNPFGTVDKQVGHNPVNKP